MTLVYKDRVKEDATVTGAGGAYQLSGPVGTKFEGFVAAVGDGARFEYAAFGKDGSDFERGVGTVTDGSPDTITRVHVEESSNSDAPVVWGTNEDVTIFLTRSAKRIGMGLLDGGIKKVAAAGAGDFTAEVGFHYRIDMEDAGGADGTDRNLVVTLPSTNLEVGDTVSFEVYVENATDTGSSAFSGGPYWGVEFANGTSIRGDSYTARTGTSNSGTGEYGLHLESERVELRWNGSTWTPREGKILHDCHMRRYAASAKDQDCTGSTKIQLDTAVSQNGVDADTTNNVARVRRTGRYRCTWSLRADSNVSQNEITAGDRMAAGPHNGTGFELFGIVYAHATADNTQNRGVWAVDITGGSAVQLNVQPDATLTIDCEASTGSAPNFFVQEE